MKLIIDTDVGIDDAVALFMVLAHPDAELVALTTVMGNVSLEQATHNLGVVLDTSSAPLIPIFKGNSRPLLQDEPINAIEIQGHDGLGGASAAHTDRQCEHEHASLALSRLVRQHPAQLTLLTLGPLTNVALTIRLDPSFLKGLQRLVVMGGSVDGRGNTTPSAEFNILVDPEAAAIVFDACSRSGVTLTLVSWEATLAHAVPLTLWEEMITASAPVAHLLQRITTYFKGMWWASETVLWPDPLAAAIALEPDIVQTDECRSVQIVTGNNPARGQTVVDYRSYAKPVPNARIIRQVNFQRFQQLLQIGAQL
jgi:purine nucleosidase